MISSQMGLDFSGIYVLAFHAAMVIEVPRRALIQMIQPKVSELMKDGQTIEVEKLYKRTSMLLYIPGLFLLLGLLINIDNLDRILPNGENYVSGKDVLLLIAIAKAIEMTTCMGQIVIMYSKFYYVLFLMTVGTSILGIYLNLWLIPSYGIFGAAIATFIALMIQQIIIIVSIYVKLKIHSFTLPMLWLTLLFLAILGLNSLLPPFSNHWVDALVRTLIMLSLFVFILFKLQINQEANRLILLIIKRIKSGNFKPS
jgi:O-antigen/teichoic acid export membrane protein